MNVSPALRALRIGLVVLATLLTLDVLFTVEENWRWRHAWEAERARLLASGAILNPAVLNPSPIPADQNFMAAEVLVPWLKENWSQSSDPHIKQFQAQSGSFRYLGFSRPGEEARPSLHTGAQLLESDGGIKAVSDQAAIDEARRRLAPVEPDILALRTLARERRESQFPMSATEVGFGGLFSLSQAVAWQAGLEAVEGTRREAMDDSRILMRLIEACDARKVTLLSNLVGLAVQGQLMGVFAAGERTGGWSDDQLREFEAFFAQRDEFTSLQRALRFGESSLFAGRIDALAQAPRAGWARLTPVGWIYRIGADGARNFEDALSDFDDMAHRFDAVEAREQTAARKRKGEGVAMPLLAAKAMEDACVLDKGSVVAALELYRRAHGAYPARLDDLVPQYLPRVPESVLTGKPPAYAAVDRDHFHLSSADWHRGTRPPEWIWYQ